MTETHPTETFSSLGEREQADLAIVAIQRTRMPMIATDPRQPDNPIVFANQAFLDLTGYGADELLGRNCRFLQGPDTDPAAVAMLRVAIAERSDVTVELLNYRKDGESFWNQLFISPVCNAEGTLIHFFSSSLDVTRRREAQELKEAEHRMLREVDHRAKNALALVQGIVRLSRRDTAEEYAKAVQGRVDALARAHTMLADGRWREVPLDRVVAAELVGEPAARVTLDGPPLGLPPQLVQPVALVIHEVVANARQHGALSAPDGRATVAWRERQGAGLIDIEWVETGGPPPRTDRRIGFGLTIMQAITERQLGGTLALEWRHEGLRGTITVPSNRSRDQ